MDVRAVIGLEGPGRREDGAEQRVLEVSAAGEVEQGCAKGVETEGQGTEIKARCRGRGVGGGG